MGWCRQLVGPPQRQPHALEQRLGVVLHSRGNTVTIEGARQRPTMAEPRCTNCTIASRRACPSRTGDVCHVRRAANFSHACERLHRRPMALPSARKRHIGRVAHAPAD